MPIWTWSSTDLVRHQQALLGVPLCAGFAARLLVNVSRPRQQPDLEDACGVLALSRREDWETDPDLHAWLASFCCRNAAVLTLALPVEAAIFERELRRDDGSARTYFDWLAREDERCVPLVALMAVAWAAADHATDRKGRDPQTIFRDPFSPYMGHLSELALQHGCITWPRALRLAFDAPGMCRLAMYLGDVIQFMDVTHEQELLDAE